MPRLPKFKALGPLVIGLWMVFSCLTLILAFYTSSNTEKINSRADIDENQPANLPRDFYNSLFAQKPPAGKIVIENIDFKDGRDAQLKAYLTWQGSPLSDEAATFIRVADQYNLNWLLLPSIAGKESTFGKLDKIPLNSYNPFGWGVYGTQAVRFASFTEAVETVGKGLANYAKNGVSTVDNIEYLYCPPSAGRDHSWRDGVKYFMWEIESFPEFK